MNNEIEEVSQHCKKNSETVSDDSNLNEEEEDDNSLENSRSKNISNGRWMPTEHILFLEALMLYGNEWKQVQEHIKTRSSTQARSHAQKFFIRLKKELQDQSDTNIVKEKINEKFTKELQEKYDPIDKDKFLDMMIKLVYNSEANLKKQPIITTSTELINKNMKFSPKAIVIMHSGSIIKEKKRTNEQKQRLLIKGLKKKTEKIGSDPIDYKPRLDELGKGLYPHAIVIQKPDQIFLIEKDKMKVSRKQSMASNQDQDKQGNELQYNDTYYNFFKNFNSIHPSSINIFACSIDDNFINNFLLNSNTHLPSTTMTNHEIENSNPFDIDTDTEWNERAEPNRTNPFNLEFNYQKESNDNYSNNNCNENTNDLFSLF